MTRFFTFLTGIMLSYGALAQLPDGSIAPDFTATDINGVEHNLYTYLDSGYQVVLYFFATWVGPDFAYLESGVMQDLYETYGPTGANDIRVFWLEADDNTSLDDLYGTGFNTQGDYVTGTPFPIIDNAQNIFEGYQNIYYPTIYTICPNRILTESGQVDVAAHASIFQAATCQPASVANDPYVVNSDSDLYACQGEATLRVNLMNNGLDVLSACTITAYDGSTVVGAVDWTGELDTYEVETVEVTTASLTAQTTFDIEITSPDEISTNNSTSATVEPIEQQSTNNVRLNLLTDGYPNETSWALYDLSLNVVEQGGPYSVPGEDIIVDMQLDLGCYIFVLQDAFGDGLHASWFDGVSPDGSFSLESMSGNFVESTLYTYAAPDEFQQIVVPFEVTSVVSPPGSGCDELYFTEYVEGFGNNKALEIYNPTSDWVDLSDYQIERYANGSTSATEEQKAVLSGMLAPQDVVVCVLDKQDPDGVEFEAPVWDELAAKADLWLSPVYDENNTMYFNGNDAMVLRQISTNTVLDVIGKVGEDPGFESGWAGLTTNHTLIRKFEVIGGDGNAVDDFLVVDQWDAVAWSEDNIAEGAIFDDLGFHDCLCGTTTSSGCTDPAAFNYVPSAIFDDGSCVYFVTTCDFLGNDSWDVLPPGLYIGQPQVEHELGVYVNGEFVLHLPPFYVDDNGGSYEVSSWDNLVWSGLPEGLSLTDAPGQIAGNAQACVSYSGTPYEEGTFEVTVTGELMVAAFGSVISVSETASFTMVITPNADGILGCTYAHALNFNPVANVDNGSCEFGGCTDPNASNFEPHASVDDGTCEAEPCLASCIGDLNNDSSVGAADLLVLLTAFGGECE